MSDDVNVSIYKVRERKYELMENWINLLDKEILTKNINIASLFILNYECLKDYVINQIRSFYSDLDFKNLELIETENYKKNVRSLDGNLEDASLKWFIQHGAITRDDYDIYQNIRKKRNEITHEFLKNLVEGFSDNDLKLFCELIKIYQKVDKWWINEVEIPISGEDIIDTYNREEVFGSESMILSVINDIILNNNENKYEEALNIINEYKNFK